MHLVASFLILAGCGSAPLAGVPRAEASSCGSISNNDLRYLCQSGRRFPGPF